MSLGKAVVFGLLLCLCAGMAAAQAWKPAPVTLMTEWGARVTPDNAWREYPRPQFVRERWENLNGLWEYAIAAKTAPAPTAFEGRILVPYAVESALSGVGRALQPDQRLWYRRSFSVPAAWRGERVLLHFGAVDYECVLWVNGGLVGAHKGGFDAFTFDVTPFLKDGANEILLGVTDPSDTADQPRGKQQLSPQGIWYTPVSGIWQTVWLEPVPAALHLAELRLTPDVDAGGVHVAPLTQEPVADDTYAVRVTASAAGQAVATTIVRVNREGFLKIPNARLWSPADPFLHLLAKPRRPVFIEPQRGGPAIRRRRGAAGQLQQSGRRIAAHHRHGRLLERQAGGVGRGRGDVGQRRAGAQQLVEVLYDEKGAVKGVATGDMGIGRDGQPLVAGHQVGVQPAQLAVGARQ